MDAKHISGLVVSPDPAISTGRDMKILAAFYAAAAEVHGPTIWDADVRHDDDCPRLANTGPCSCNVEILVTDLETGRQVLLKHASSHQK